MVPLKAGFSGHVGRFIRAQFKELQDRTIDSGGNEFCDFDRRGMPPSLGSYTTLGDRNDGEEFEFHDGLHQFRIDPEKVPPQDASPLFLPLAEKGASGTCRDQNRITALESASTQIESLGIQTDGCAA